ncbi:3D domain-containing protein [Thalassobacillus sp. CUG 92003]|uniref:3D domain-containing protein n=1 Tax=Thalassobacillus sp. CUG 92003 TaxID=2736641 RepID=UPI0015E7A2BA|nr:3D domain-containing protein [Thalassobacillus sp. CUG 92003]
MKKTVLSFTAAMAISGAFAAQAHAEDYVVNKGDTLWGISQENDTSVKQLKQWNNLSSNTIYPNDRLTVSAENDQQTQSNEGQSTYTVKSGDTLWGISQDYSVTVDNLKSWNNLSSNLIHPGQDLAVKGNAAKETTAPSNNSGSNNSNSSEQSASKETSNDNSSDSEQNNEDVAKEFTATATAYTANCTGCSGVTRTGIDLNANPDKKVIAVDPDVIPLGSEVYVEGYGRAVAGDTGGAINGQKIDVFIPSKQEALNWGRKEVNVKVLD